MVEKKPEEKQLKTTGVTFFVTAEEMKRLDEKAERAGMNRSAYIRHRTIYEEE